MRAYFIEPHTSANLNDLRAEHQDWLKSFARLRDLALTGAEWRGPAQELTDRILQQLNYEETEVYPQIDDFLKNHRPTREMRYEHSGIRHFLPELPQTLESARDNTRWERFSLNLIHLLEHHIEHEERGLYPIYERIRKEGKRRDGVQ